MPSNYAALKDERDAALAQLARIRKLAEGYYWDQVDAQDRPSSWDKLHALVDAARQPQNDIEGGD